MHGRVGEEEECYRRRHMWSVHAPATPPPAASATPVVLSAIGSSNGSAISFQKDGRKITVGDCALFQSGNSPPFIGIIRWFSPSKGKLGVNWLYRPSDVKLAKGVQLEAAPNEIFYSFHRDEISAESLLHPCKVAFLRKGVELPSGVLSFVCRRVYDVANKCLWWLTDKDYINERQEEVDRLLDKTQLEMHAAVQSGGRSPKTLNGHNSAQQLKTGSDSVQNSGSPASSQVKGKKRDRADLGLESIKQDRTKPDDGDPGNVKPDSSIKSEISRITDKGGLTDAEGVEKLLSLMQLDRADKKIDFSARVMLADVIAATDRYDCLLRFVQQRGVLVLDDWLQEAHKGKNGDGSSPKDSDKPVDELLLALLRALDKLPVNLHVLQTSNVGKSVNNLRGHKNLEIQKKARNLVDTWKKRVDAEMNKLNDSKSAGSSPAVSWSGKQGLVDGVHGGHRRSGSSELASKGSTAHPSHYKILAGKPANGDSSIKSTIQPGSLKSQSTGASPLAISSREAHAKPSGTAGISDTQMSGKDERSSGSSQSHNNSQSCSSDHAKNVSASLKEDARSSTAGSMNLSKSSSTSSRHRKPSNGLTGAAVVGSQKEAAFGGKPISLSRNMSSDKVSQSGVTADRLPDPPAENGNSQRLIVRLPNPGRCPTQSASSSSFEEPPVSGSRASSPVAMERRDPDEHKKVKENLSNSATDANAKSSVTNHDDKGAVESDESGRSPATLDEEPRSDGGNGKQDVAKGASLSVAIERRQISSEPKSGDLYEAPVNPINVLIESCVKYSDASAPFSAADDIGMNLLASVATGEIARSGSPSDSPSRSSRNTDDHSSATDGKSKATRENAPVQNESKLDGGAGGESEKNSNVVGILLSKMESGHTTADIGIEWKPAPISPEPKSNVDHKPEGELSESNSEGGHILCPPEKEESSETDKSNLLRLKRKVSRGIDDGSAIAKKKTSPSDENIPTNSDRPRIGANDLSKGAHFDHSLGDDGEAARSSSTKMPQKETVEEIPLQNHSETDLEKQDVGIVRSETSVPNEKCSLAAVGKTETCNVSSGSSPSSSFAVIEGIHVSKSGDTDVIADKSETLRREQAGVCIPTIPLSTVSATEQIKEEDSHSVSVSCQEQIVLQSGDIEQDKMPIEVKLTASRKEATDLTPVDAESLPTTSGRDSPVKCEFDLNEGASGDEANQGEPSTSAPVGCPSTVPLSGFLPFNFPPISSSAVPITVAAPAKGPFRPPETPLKSKSEVGWKGSAATSAFRPAEPRKVLDIPVSSSETSSETAALKQSRPILDFDLNVPDDRVLQEITSERSCLGASSEPVVLDSHDTQQRSIGGLDLDLNRADEGTESAQLSTNISKRPEIPNLVVRPAPVVFPNGEVSASREFDLNNGPGLDEGGGEPLTRSHYPNTSVAPFLPPAPAPRMSNPVLGSLSSWFPPGNSYSTVAIPQYIPDRGDHSYSFAGASGTQSYLANTTGATSFSNDLYRAPVLTSPAMTFPSYPTFPFGPSFPLASASFSGAPTTFVESSSSGAPGFAPIHAQLPGAAAAPSAPYLRPILISLPDSTTAGSSGAESSRKWVRQGLDLNAGPGSADAEGRDERLLSTRQQFTGPQAFADEQAARTFQLAGGGLKRKEPDGGWEAPRFPYKQPSRQ